MRGRTQDQAGLGDGTVASFLALHGNVSVWTGGPESTRLCADEPFHWNGSELVICSVGTASWSGRDVDTVDVSLKVGELKFKFSGAAVTDQVVGAAPEYREQLVTYLGNAEGNAVADAADTDVVTHRLFITPTWRT